MLDKRKILNYFSNFYVLTFISLIEVFIAIFECVSAEFAMFLIIQYFVYLLYIVFLYENYYFFKYIFLLIFMQVEIVKRIKFSHDGWF